jgi:putative spermidine/putrescine transport system ATP-binding protein
MVLKIDGLTKSFKGEKVLSGVGFSVASNELVSIIGPSGAGKTTLLKIIAGLEKPDSGMVYKKSEAPAILVFQDYILFPSMSIYDNVAFGLRTRHIDRKIIDLRVRGILKKFGIEDKMLSYPAEISAGQKQRAAIARAIVLNPDILLLDEPFANLDKNLKLETADFIRHTQKEYRTAVLIVTHDQQEAFMISDKIGILIKGRLIQYDTVENVYNRPVSIEAASFLGHVNIIPEKFRAILCAGSEFKCDEMYARAESFIIEKDAEGPAVVSDLCFAGHFIIYRVLWDDWLCTIYRLEGDIGKGERVRLILRG